MTFPPLSMVSALRPNVPHPSIYARDHHVLKDPKDVSANNIVKLLDNICFNVSCVMRCIQHRQCKSELASMCAISLLLLRLELGLRLLTY